MSKSDGSAQTVRGRRGSLSRYQRTTFFVGGMVVSSFFWDSRFALGVLFAYLVFVFFVAPYFLRLGFFLPIINKADCTASVSLTFDDGPDPEVTLALLELLAKYDLKACFFVIGQKAERHPDIIRRIIREGHEIGNHSNSHDPLLMLRSQRTLKREIKECQSVLCEQGVQPLVFRPPAGITNPKLYKVLRDLGLVCVGFSCRPLDFGNRRLQHLKDRVLKSVRAGQIILLHDVHPNVGFRLNQWLCEIDGIIQGLIKKDLKIIPLSQLLQQPVMRILSQESTGL